MEASNLKNLGKFWAGRVYGTNTGNIFLSLEQNQDNLTGTLRFLDDQFGVAVYRVSGVYNDKVQIVGTPEKAHERVELGEIKIESSLTPEGNLKGSWESSLGTAGLFVLYPHGEGQREVAENFEGVPEQFYTQNISLGSLTLFEQDIQKLIHNVLVDFETGRAVVTYNDGGPDVTRYADVFLETPPDTSELKYLKIFVQEPDVHGVNKIVNVEISAFGSNEIRVQGVRESWVIGKSSSLENYLKKFESSLVTTYKKFGLNLNQIIFLAMLVVIPDIDSIQNRGIFVVAIFILLSVFLWTHSKFIPNAKINLTKPKASFIERIWPTVTSWVVAASASLVAALIFWWLVGDAP